MESSRHRSVRKSLKNFQLSSLDSVVGNESTFEFGFHSTFMDWDDIDEDNDYSPPPSDDEEEFPETPETPYYDYSPLYKNEEEEFPETPEPKRQQDWENSKPKTCPQNQTLGLKPLSLAPIVSFRPIAFFPVKPVSVPKSTQPEGIKPLGKGKQTTTALDEPTSTSESTSVENAEALQVENTAVKSEVECLKELLQQKDQKLADAEKLKADHFEEQMSHKTELLPKAETSLSHMTEAQNKLAKEREENTSLKQEMAELRKAHEEDKAATEKKFLELLSKNEKSMEQLRETITEKETIMSKFEKVSRTRIVKLLGQIDDLKMEQQKKDYMLREAAGKAEHLEEQMSQERQQWQEDKSSVLQEIAHLKTALKDKETEVTKSKRVSKKKNVQLLRQMDDLKAQHEQEHLDLTSQLEMQKECLLNYHELTLTEAYNQLAKEREENLSLKQEMAELRKVHEEEKAAIKNSNAASSGEIFKLQCQIEGLKREHEKEFTGLINNFEKEKKDLEEHYNRKLNSQMDQMEGEIKRCQEEKDSLLEEIGELQRNCEKHKAACHRTENKEMEKLQRTIREKDAIISQSGVIWSKKLEQRDQQLETITQAALKNKMDLSREIHLLQERIEQDRIKTNVAKLSFDLKVKESTKLRAALVQKELEGQKQLEQERQQLEEEKSTLSQQIAHLKKVVKKKKTIIRKTQEDFQVQIHQLQQQVDELKEKTTKKGVGRRLLNLFRRSRKKD
ncbi:restin homolog [Oryzias latipes]|uniref:restin homolog n=1 Tax=Oryzias latipes TaxID=8090 RepID=UPI000CE1E2A6|nr:restin homolog [Oryzias latipes]